MAIRRARPVLAALCVLSNACVAGSHEFRGARSLPLSPATLTARDGTPQVIADSAVVRLPDGAELAGRAAMLAALGESGLTGAELFLYPEGRHQCTSAHQEYGAYVVERGGVELAAGLYGVLWDDTGAEPIALDVSVLPRTAPRHVHRASPCLPVTDSLFHTRGIGVGVHYGFMEGEIDARFQASLERAGWQRRSAQTALGRNARPSRAHVGAHLLVPIRGRIGTDIVVARYSGAVLAESSSKGIIVVSYAGTVTEMLPSLRFGPVAIFGGPSRVGLSSKWHTLFNAEDPPSRRPPESMSTWSLGATAGARAVMVLTSRFGVFVRAQQRFHPDVEFAGYRDADPVRVDFSHPAVSAGLVLKLP